MDSKKARAKQVTIEIDCQSYSVPSGLSVLEAARLVHIDIPSLCYLKEINEVGTCRVCVVEIEGSRTLDRKSVV